MSDKDGGAAFPRPVSDAQFFVKDGATRHDAQEGLSARDYFAAKAMAALIVGGNPTNRPTQYQVAHAAYEIADAMLLKRESKP